VAKKTKVKDVHVKGSNFERAILKTMTRWTHVQFFRTPLSGNKRYKFDLENTRADLVAENARTPEMPFSFECKAQEDWDLRQFYSGKNRKIVSFLQQATRDAELVKKTPLVLLKKNYLLWLALLPYTDALRQLLEQQQSAVGIFYFTVCQTEQKFLLTPVKELVKLPYPQVKQIYKQRNQQLYFGG